ncbi:MAG: hypothetical protein KDI38_12770 [Calditrichaeota bacterium]|nr:hypothetical protein [Calditrichota bacterium]MCB9087928.1 hypothetical protein [Calditrichia bacterium]
MKTGFSLQKPVNKLLQKQISVKSLIAIILIICAVFFGYYLHSGRPKPGDLITPTQLFVIESALQKDLDRSVISPALIDKFRSRGITLSSQATISVEQKKHRWILLNREEEGSGIYVLQKREDEIQVYIQPGLGIKELIRLVKKELQDSELELERKHEAALFNIKTFDLEISFVVRVAYTQKGMLEYQFITVDSEFESGSEKIQRIQLHMEVVQPETVRIKPSATPLKYRPDEIVSPDTIRTPQ